MESGAVECQIHSSKGGSGGGFMPNVDSSPSSLSASKEQVRRVQNVVPLAVRQILSCQPNEDFTLFGFSVHIAHLVAILRNFDVQSTKATCVLEDHTGRIKAVLWLDTEKNATKDLLFAVKEGTYVEVFGTIRTNENEKMLMIMKWTPVTDCNVITNHLLRVINTRLEAEELRKKIKGESTKKANNPGKELATSMSMLVDNEGNQAQQQQSLGINASLSDGLTSLQSKIFNVLKQDQGSTGIHKQMILNQFSSNQMGEVCLALEFLVDEGHAYTTIDNDHFKATD